jgi:hypothetical protein
LRRDLLRRDVGLSSGLGPRVLLAWESGAGRGHIVTLKTVAEALGNDFVFDAALCIMDHAAELAPLCDLVFPGARLFVDERRRRAPGAPRTATWGEFMGDTGFCNGEFLAVQVAWWQVVLTSRRTELLVADYSPCALMAAYGLGIPAVAVGTGYGIPPVGLETFPVFLPEYAERIYDEEEMVAGINAAVGPLGVPPLLHLSDVYRRTDELVRTFDLLDPYISDRERPLLPPVGCFSSPKDRLGDEIFVYFSTAELHDPDVVEAIASLALPVRAFCPGIAPEIAQRFKSAGIIIEPAPVPHDLIAKRSRLMVHAGQHGIVCLGLAAGLPQVAIPQHLEHLYLARRCEGFGTGRVATLENRSSAALLATIEETYADRAMSFRAAQVAASLRDQCSIDSVSVIRQRLLAILA